MTGTGGTDDEARARAEDRGVVPHTFDLYTYTGDCSTCHRTGGTGPTFAQIHPGSNKAIYAADGSKYSAAIKTNIDSATFDSGTTRPDRQLQRERRQRGGHRKPTVVVSLYGYDTKDFVVSGHGEPAGSGRQAQPRVDRGRDGQQPAPDGHPAMRPVTPRGPRRPT